MMQKRWNFGTTHRVKLLHWSHHEDCEHYWYFSKTTVGVYEVLKGMNGWMARVNTTEGWSATGPCSKSKEAAMAYCQTLFEQAVDKLIEHVHANTR